MKLRTVVCSSSFSVSQLRKWSQLCAGRFIFHGKALRDDSVLRELGVNTCIVRYVTEACTVIPIVLVMVLLGALFQLVVCRIFDTSCAGEVQKKNARDGQDGSILYVCREKR